MAEVKVFAGADAKGGVGDSLKKLTPFMIFFVEHRDRVKAAQPAQASAEDVSRAVCALWRSLPSEKVKGYCLLSNAYSENIERHGLGPLGKRKLTKTRRKKDPRQPKISVSAFVYFSRHHRNILRKEHEDLTFAELGKTVGALWKASNAAEKKPFEDLANEDKERHSRELEEWLSAQGKGNGEVAGEPPGEADELELPDAQEPREAGKGTST
ncbi:unnamed protein product [Discosporangium mesarthrocarpum]